MSRTDTSPWAPSSARLVSLGGAALLVWAGCAKVNTVAGTTGSGGVRGTMSGTGGGFGSGTGGTIGRDNDGGLIISDASQGICQEGNYKSVPQIPTVFILVDRSGSMFGCRSGGALDPTGRECANRADTSWYPMRDGVLTVVSQLQDQVRFGFAAFTGEKSDPVCPVITPVPPALQNQMNIATAYNALAAPPKGETPTRKAVQQIGDLLKADTTPGEKFILFITDGEPDFCDDGTALCASDSVVGELQSLRTAGVKTLVMGISSPLTTISDAILQAFANAGAGQPVVPSLPASNATDLNAIWDQCNFINAWKADFALTNKVGMHQNNGTGPYSTIGEYVTTGGGTATVYKPNVANQTALVNEIARALSGVKSCTFDLNNLNGKKLTVDLTMLNLVRVNVMNVAVPLDTTNGWRMNSASELELVGSACADWRMPQNMNIDIQIPCAAIIIQ